MRNPFKRLGRVISSPSPDGSADRYVGDPRFDDWEVVRDFEDLESAQTWCQFLDEGGFDAERAADVVPPPVLTAESCHALRQAVDGVKVTEEVREYIASIVRATREDTALTLGGSPRATVALFRAARAAALLAGRDFATPDDVKDFAIPVLRHRVVIAPELEVEGRSADDVLQGLLSRVAAPQ